MIHLNGPTGILRLREACAEKNIIGFASEENFDDWLKRKFERQSKPIKQDRKSKETNQFNKICESLELFTISMQRQPKQYQDLNEENIRDRILTPLNVIFKGRGHAESKNCQGKTDILVRTKDGLNEHIFELKVWEGIHSLIEAIDQLLGYLSWHNNYCGIIIFCYNKNYTSVLQEAQKYLKEKYNFYIQEQNVANEFRFRMTHKTDVGKSIQTYLTFVNLRCNNDDKAKVQNRS